jgi:preprotein translocase subunit SecG
MYGFLITIFVLVCILQTIVILLQSSKGGGLAGAFGGSSMGAMFGGRGAATFLSKVTAVLATVFMVVALVLGMMRVGGGEGQGLVEQERQTRVSSPAAILPSVSGSGTEVVTPQQQPAPPAQQPDTSK